MISQKLAVRYLADEMEGCPVPMTPESFRIKRWAEHDYVFFGHVPVRAYKHANRWRFSEPDVRGAVRTIAALPWDPEDLIDPRLDAHGKSDPLATTHSGWRTEIQNMIRRAAATEREEKGCRCGPLYCQQEETDWGLPCSLTPDALLQRCSSYTMACTLPVPTLVWVDDTWLIPRTLVYILDQQQEAESKLKAAAQQCSGCGAHSTDPTWRAPSTTGWKVLCPACTAAKLRSYRQELKGVAYARVRERGPRAEDFLCAVCETPRPATNWDHCHQHELIRGPLCGSCNTAEGQGKEFLARKGSVQHLLRCDGCRTQRTFPLHHRLAALRLYLHRKLGAQGCDWLIHMCVNINETGEGGYDCTVRCPGQGTSGSRGLRLTAAEAEHILSLMLEDGEGAKSS
ncbi:endonuclease domain-containing protein [Streptomyces botrytidirepellens]|nr:endonuclease domain-containing protein [Streptomyces botrytidirepellens]